MAVEKVAHLLLVAVALDSTHRLIQVRFGDDLFGERFAQAVFFSLSHAQAVSVGLLHCRLQCLRPHYDNEKVGGGRGRC